ncbi:MAG: ammonium transporter [Desulfamplus sp.]|nr:ammonium transporter [Desulfamplus sp.]
MGNSVLDNFWVIVSSVLVFLMQPGFMCLESGMTRSKNSINVAIKNLADFVFSVMGFWLLGFGLMFGTSWSGMVGISGFMAEFGDDFHISSFFLFQTMFCGTATTIFSGAVAERMRFSSYLIVAVLLSVFIYPILGHWAWNGIDSGSLTGWLGASGFVDFAGSTVVHSVGGWVAMATLLVIGPRKGRFSPDGTAVEIHGGNLPLSVLGALLLWIGWIGFNGGSTLAMDNRVPGIIVNTLMAGAAGSAFSLLAGYLYSRIAKVSYLINGSLGGLVAVTACCHCVTVPEAIIIGAIAGGVSLVVEELLLHYRIDDAVSAVPVHLGCGIWGTLAVALFGDPLILDTGLSFPFQLMVQVEGIVAAFLLAFVIPFFIISRIDRIMPIRVSSESEEIGLNISEHGAKTETADFFRIMQLQEETGDLSLRVPADPFTDTGVIAARYNKVIAALQNAADIFQQLFDGSPQAVLSTDSYGIITRANRGFESIFGYPADQITGSHNCDVIVPENMVLEMTTIRQTILSGKSVHKETSRKHRTGKLIPVSLLGFPIIINGAIDGIFYVYQDITERKELENQLYRKAFYDSLTGVPNRILFMERLGQAVTRQKRKKEFQFAIFMIDLDRFKWVNDNMGHHAGDMLLEQVAQRFLCCVRSVDTVARLGGDEFAVLLEDIGDSREIIAIARRIRNETSKVFKIQGNDVHISASIGIVINTSLYRKSEEILRDADIAMYRAKATGKSRYMVFNKKLHKITHDALQLENDLKEALKKNELLLYYQPVVCSKTEKIKGFEALLRWMHPTRGMVSPADFIPLAEETGLIIPIGQWVIEEACRQLKKWQTTLTDSGHPSMSMSVNISSRQFMHNDLEQTIKNALEAVDLSPYCFVAELTESAVMEKPESVIGQLKRLKETGIRIAIDDFGTGYSSLAYLKRFPLDYLKMDKSFVDEINTDHENMEIAKTIIILAHNLNLKVIAEGIERMEQLETLRGLNCDYIQGYFYSKPVAERQAMQLIEKGLRLRHESEDVPLIR